MALCVYMVNPVQNEQAFSKTQCMFNYHLWWSQSRMNRVFQKHNVCYLMSIYGHSRPEWTGFSCPVRVKYQSRMNRLFQKAKCVSTASLRTKFFFKEQRLCECFDGKASRWRNHIQYKHLLGVNCSLPHRLFTAHCVFDPVDLKTESSFLRCEHGECRVGLIITVWLKIRYMAYYGYYGFK